VSLSAIPQLSIVIPIGKVDQLDGNLLRSIAAFEQQAELIVVCGRAPTQAEQVALVHWKKHRWLQTKWGRALQLNAGCKAACGRWIWMLHADSILDAVALQSVQNRLRTDSRDLFYFSLRFRQDGPESVRLNAVAANIRSALLKIPFGDQGFLIMKESLSSLGWLRTDLPFGEDHDLVWRMRIAGHDIKHLAGTVETSARKYAKAGWGQVTRDHVAKTFQQAFPLWLKLWSVRLGISRRRHASIGIAAFVKTFGYSALKTRLAASSSRELADEFYAHSVDAVGEWLHQCAWQWGASTYWAVAENPCIVGAHWSTHALMAQGSGGLGERLHLVYDQLLRQHGAAVIVGTDSPQLSDELDAVLSTLKNERCVVLGRCPDGGFYLVAGNVAIPRWVWTSVTYSATSTCDELIRELKSQGIQVRTIRMLSDVDEYSDLSKVTAELKSLLRMTPSQSLLAQWLGRITKV